MLQVYIDFKSPYAFVALRPCWQLEEQYGIAIEWLPLTLNIASYLGTAKLDAQGKVAASNRSQRQWQAVRYAYMDARRYAASQGLILRGTEKIWDSSIAAIGLLWASDKAADRQALRKYMTLIFDQFWKRELDIENPAVVESVLREADVPVIGFFRRCKFFYDLPCHSAGRSNKTASYRGHFHRLILLVGWAIFQRVGVGIIEINDCKRVTATAVDFT